MKWSHGASFLSRAVLFRSATRLLLLKLALAWVICAPVLWISVQGQGGFVSIDSGASAAYTSANNISWVPDGTYISTGKDATIVPNATIARPYDTLRYFPADNQTKHCYILNTTADMSYLVRASFLYGDYVGSTSNGLPSFELLFDATHWTTVSISNSYELVTHEMIVAATGSSFSVCVARTNLSSADPFISSLELRPLSADQNMYSPVHQNFLMKTNSRINFGQNDSTNIRYPDDDYDRIWDSDVIVINNISQYNSMYTKKNVTSFFSVDKPPSTVMQTARTTALHDSMTFSLAMEKFGPGQYYLALYFAEISNATSQRIIDIYIDQILTSGGVNVSHPFGPFSTLEIYTKDASLSGVSYDIRLASNVSSKLAPIINAAESYFLQKAELQTDDQDVRALADIMKVLNLPHLGGDPCLPASYKWSLVSCSNSTPPRVTALNLSHVGLNSTVPTSIANLTELATLDLSDNELHGNIPSWLMNLSNLVELDLQNNNLSGEVPSGFRNSTHISTSGNPLLCKPWGENACVSAPVPSLSLSSPKNDEDLTIGLVSAGTIFFVICALGVAIYRCKRHGKGRFLMANSGHWPPVPPLTEMWRSADPVTGLQEEGKIAVRNYSFAEMRTITNDFEKNIAAGNFGGVFYGRLPSGQEVVVKLLQTKFQQSPTEFLTKVTRLSNAHHKNILRMTGYCVEYYRQTLVYEYMPRGSLYHHLYAADHESLEWKFRLTILQQVAQGLEHLHCACSPSIVHGNVKSMNVLLSDAMTAKVSDYGVCGLLPDGVGIDVDATSGYLDPEYFMLNNLTEKSDIYSFGVLLLEVVSGRAPFDTSLPKEQWTIVDWVHNTLQKGNYELVADPSLHGIYNIDALSKVIEVALQCLKANVNERPSISEIVLDLKEANKMEIGHHVAFAELTPGDSSNTDDSSLPLTLPIDSCGNESN